MIQREIYLRALWAAACLLLVFASVPAGAQSIVEGNSSFTTYTTTNFKFAYGGSTYSLGGTATSINDPSAGPGSNCPANMIAPSVLVLNLPPKIDPGCVINFVPVSTGGGSAALACSTTVSGYISPKYVVLGVSYAPPGASSYAQYITSTTFGQTNTIANTFSSAYAQKVSVSISAGLFGWVGGTTTGTISNTYTQSSTDSTSDTVTSTTSLTTSTPGPANSYAPVNHDYDVVWLWLNPVVLMNFTESPSGAVAGITWKGYGFSALDQPAMDVYPVYVGWLNGDLPLSAANAKPLARAWAAGEIWPSGQGPALSASDYAQIEQADPYWSCSTPHPTTCPGYINPDRYTITDGEDIPYAQAPVGGQPIPEVYTLGYSVSDTQSAGYTTSNSVMFGLETSFKGSVFGTGVSTTFSSSNTFTWTNQVNTSLTKTDSTTASASITGPPCVVSGNVCNPTYTGPTEFDVYEDNLYGTFFFNPVN